MRVQSLSRFARAAASFALLLSASASFGAVPYSEDWGAGDTNGWIENTTSSVVLRDALFGNPAATIEQILDQIVSLIAD